MEHNETCVNRKEIYTGKVFNVFQDQVSLGNGQLVTRDLVQHHGGVALVAVVPGTNNLLLVRQFRYGAGKTMLELPAGKIDPGEDPRMTGLRELREETGYQAKELTLLTEMFPTPAYDSEKIYIYQAEDLTPGPQSLDENELLTVEQIPLSLAVELCLSGRLIDAKTQVGILTYAVKQKGIIL